MHTHTYTSLHTRAHTPDTHTYTHMHTDFAGKSNPKKPGTPAFGQHTTGLIK